MKRLNDVVPERMGDFRRWYLSRAEPGHELSVRYVELTGIVAPHTHYVEETIFCIEEKGVARVGERELSIRPGTMLVIPPGTVHSSIKEGQEPLRYLGHFRRKPRPLRLLTRGRQNVVQKTRSWENATSPITGLLHDLA